MSKAEIWAGLHIAIKGLYGADYTSESEYDRSVIGFEIQKIESLLHMMLGKGWGTSNAQEIAAIRSILPDPKVVFDVGANIGSWSELALTAFPNAKIVAFEPSSKNIECLASIAAKNSDRHCVVHAAVSDKPGLVVLHADREGSTLGSLYQRDLKEENVYFSKSETVRAVTLGDEIKRLEMVPDVIKIDVEGHELPVLLGATDFLSQVKVIQFEFGGTMVDSRYFFRDFHRFLTSHGFSIARIGQLGLVPIPTYYVGHESFDIANYLAFRS